MVKEEEGKKKEGRKLITLRRFTFLLYTLQNLGPVPVSAVAFNLLVYLVTHSLFWVVGPHLSA